MKKKKNIGILLVSLSFCLILFGFLYNLIVSKVIVQPSKDHIVNNSDTHITVTSKDDKSYQVNKDGKVVDENGEEVVSNVQKNVTNNENKTTNNLDTINENLKNNIETKYGIDIKYGSETVDYKIGGLTTEALYDSNIINSELNLLNNLIGLYPNNFFNELDESIPLTIILVNNYSNTGVCGLTDSSYSYAVMSIAVGTEFVETFHHEIYHYMERYIYKNDGAFSNWSSYNPIGFVYGNINDNFPVYNKSFLSDVYFVNSYSKTDQFEDRASIFEYLMANSKASCLNKDMPVYKKALVMSDIIDRYIKACSTTKTEYWERFLVQ